MNLIATLSWLMVLLLAADRAWKLLAIRSFFGANPPPSGPSASLTLIQPVVSGDPHLRTCLESNLVYSSRHQIDHVYVVESLDQEALELCRELSRSKAARIIEVAPAPQGVSPKTHKLKAGLAAGGADLVAFLDDDTCLPPEGLEEVVAYLQDPAVGVVHGLPTIDPSTICGPVSWPALSMARA